MLEEHMNTTGTSYDYVFRTRHDMHMERNLLTWPGADFGKILFQPKCVICNGFDSTQKCADDLKDRGVVEETLRKPGCKVFTDDKILWTPKRYLRVLLRKLRHDAENDDDGGCTRLSDYTHSLAEFCFPADAGASAATIELHGHYKKCQPWREEKASRFPPGSCAFLADPYMWFAGGGKLLFSYRPRRGSSAQVAEG